MKRVKAHHLAAACVFALVLLATAEPVPGQIRPTARYEGQWNVLPNGDVHVTRRFQLPMQLYRMWKNADVHMLEFRNFETGRANVEVIDKKADWDDVNRTLTMNMTVLGLSKNMATHWEAKMVPGLEFSNLDGARKIAYFHFALDGPMGRVQGQDVVSLPPECTRPAWNASGRTINYVMPAPPAVAQAEASSPALWWVLFGLCALLAAVAWGASFVVRPAGAKPAEPPSADPAEKSS